MSAGPCEHGMPSPASCVSCMEEVGLGAPERPASESPFVEARFNGTRCRMCEGTIWVGDTIGAVESGWAHAGCLR